MNFENKLISGLFVKRYKRFFVDVKVNNKIITAHCPNTGSMSGLLIKDNKVCCQIKMFFAHLEDKNKVLLGVRLKKTRSF